MQTIDIHAAANRLIGLIEDTCRPLGGTTTSDPRPRAKPSANPPSSGSGLDNGNRQSERNQLCTT